MEGHYLSRTLMVKFRALFSEVSWILALFQRLGFAFTVFVYSLLLHLQLQRLLLCSLDLQRDRKCHFHTSQANLSLQRKSSPSAQTHSALFLFGIFGSSNKCSLDSWNRLLPRREWLWKEAHFHCETCPKTMGRLLSLFHRLHSHPRSLGKYPLGWRSTS